MIDAIRGKDRARVIIGDATSRLVLEDAGVDLADAVIISTTTERVNLEVARVLSEHFSPRRVISIGITEKGTKELEALGVEVKNIFTASANDIRNLIEHQAKTAHGIGIGRSEILEVEVHANSRLKNKPLGSIAPIRWRIGIIYRDGNIILPKRDTVLKEKDRVIILGDPDVLRTVAEMLTADFQKFPLEYGTSLLVYAGGSEDERFFEEVHYVYNLLGLNTLYVVYATFAERMASGHDSLAGRYGWKSAEKIMSALPFREAIRSVIAQRAVAPGLVMLSPNVIGSGSLFATRGRAFLLELAQDVECPILLTQGTFPYEKMVVPGLAGIDFQHQIIKAIELSHTINCRLSAALAQPSPYLSAAEEMQRFEESKRIVSNAGFVHRQKIALELYEGNPVHEIVKIQNRFNLLVLGTKGWVRKRGLRLLLSPDVAGGILRRATISSIVLPGVEESL